MKTVLNVFKFIKKKRKVGFCTEGRRRSRRTGFVVDFLIKLLVFLLWLPIPNTSSFLKSGLFLLLGYFLPRYFSSLLFRLIDILCLNSICFNRSKPAIPCRLSPKFLVVVKLECRWFLAFIHFILYYIISIAWNTLIFQSIVEQIKIIEKSRMNFIHLKTQTNSCHKFDCKMFFEY